MILLSIAKKSAGTLAIGWIDFVMSIYAICIIFFKHDIVEHSKKSAGA
jgi:hypothetical protein